MEAETLDRYESKGLTWPFRCSRKGEVITSQSGAVFKNEVAQMATVIFETIGAIGDIKVDRVEIVGEKMGIIMELDSDGLIGSLFKRTPETSKSELWRLIDELKQQGPLPAEKKKIETPGAGVKVRVKVDKRVFDEMKERVKEYLGDFTERIFKNQLKAQRIDLDNLYDEDARRFILALGKAAGMIIGPSKGHEMTNRLLTLLK